MQHTDIDGAPVNVGDRVRPMGWGSGVPLWLANTPATVVKLGRTRISVRFDGVDCSDRLDSAPARDFRRIGGTP